MHAPTIFAMMTKCGQLVCAIHIFKICFRVSVSFSHFGYYVPLMIKKHDVPFY